MCFSLIRVVGLYEYIFIIMRDSYSLFIIYFEFLTFLTVQSNFSHLLNDVLSSQVFVLAKRYVKIFFTINSFIFFVFSDHYTEFHR